MSQHHNIYSQRGCHGCKPCEGGAGNVGRQAVLWTIGIFTVGLGLLILPFFKRCQFCGHNHFMNAHAGPGQQVGGQPISQSGHAPR